jgi:hypothetical protein
MGEQLASIEHFSPSCCDHAIAAFTESNRMQPFKVDLATIVIKFS